MLVSIAAAATARDPRTVEAEQLVRRGQFTDAVELFRAVYTDAAKSGEENLRLANAAGDLAGVYVALDRYSEAEPLLQRATTIAAREAGPNSTVLALHEVTLAKLYTAQRKLTEAEAVLSHALPIIQGAFGPESPKTATALNQLGLVEDLLDRLPRAAEHYEQAIRIYRNQADSHRALVTVVSVNLIAVLVDLRDFPKAEKLGREALDLAIRDWGAAHPFTARAYHALGTVYQSEGKVDEAREMYEKALQNWDKFPGSGKLDTATAQASLASIYASRGYFAKAENLLAKAIATRESVMGPNDPELPHVLNNLGVCYASQNRFTEAQQTLERAVAIMDKSKASQPVRAIPLFRNLAGVYWNQGRLNKSFYPKAEAMYRRALEVEESRFGPNGTGAADTLVDLATVCTAEKKYREAKQLEERALAIRRAVLGPDHPDTQKALRQYTTLLRKVKD
jgi:tetratricopeptide (TPR) repeat protein